jgi:hypothetical protein
MRAAVGARRETNLYRNTSAAAAFAALVLIGSAGAADAESARVDVKADIRIAADRSMTETVHQEMTPLVESAVRQAAESKWIISGNQTFEVVEAFTRKADGRIVPADPHDFVTQDGAVGAAMSFVDLKVHQIPFRDLSVGDTTVLTVHLGEKEHYIPGQYSHPLVVSPSATKRHFDVTLHAPAALEIRHDEQQLAYEDVKAGDEIIRHWSGSVEPTTTEEKDAADVAPLFPALRFSTFPNFEAIATAYYEAAKPKLAVTPEVERLAEEITAGKQDRRVQVEAMFDWVSRNIRYVAVFFGNGRYVPNDAHTILSRRFGDCKDHAALLGVLLAAKGIESEQVLIGLDAVYELPKTPVLQAFNHVIVYVPALDRYLDPTVAFGSFDHLPGRDIDKPVVRVSDRGARLARTPRIGTDDNLVRLDTRIAMTRAGAQLGETTIEARGEFADALRAFLAAAESKGKEVELANLARLRGFLGTFGLDAPPWTETREPVRVTTKWEMQLPFNLVQAGWRAPPPFSPMAPHPNLFFGGIEPHARVYPATCRGGSIVHNLDVAMPEGVVPGPLPSAIEQRGPQFSFSERWSADGNHLRVRTEIISTVKGRVCAPDQINAVRAAYAAIEQKTNPVLTFPSPGQAPQSPVAQAGPTASAAQPSKPPPPPAAQPKIGTTNYTANPNPNCEPGENQLYCLQRYWGSRHPGQPSGLAGSPSDANQVHTVPTGPNKTAESKPEPKPSGGNPTNAAQTIQLTRAVPIERDVRLDFIYALNPDCSSVGLPSVRVVEQPQNGKVTVENGTGFSNFPPENQRYECNKRKSEGIAVVYRPNPGFAGADSVTIDIIFPTGFESKRHFSLDVK